MKRIEERLRVATTQSAEEDVLAFDQGSAHHALHSVTGVGVGALMVVLAGGPVADAASLPWPSIGISLVLGVVLAMLAAAYPARLASRLSIVRAVGYE